MLRLWPAAVGQRSAPERFWDVDCNDNDTGGVSGEAIANDTANRPIIATRKAGVTVTIEGLAGRVTASCEPFLPIWLPV